MDYSQSDVSQISVRLGYPNRAAHYRRKIAEYAIYQTYDINHRDKLYYAMEEYPCKDEAQSLKVSGYQGFPEKRSQAIGEGTVTSIQQEAKKNIPDVDLLRESQNNSK